MDLKPLITSGDIDVICQHAPNAAKAERKAALKLAVKLGKAAAVKALIDAGAKPDVELLYEASARTIRSERPRRWQ